MSSSANRNRPSTLVNLGDFAREISASPPVSVPQSQSRQPRSSRYGSSAPASKRAASRKVGNEEGRGDSPYRGGGFSASLVEPVMDERDVMSTSATSNTSSMFMQHHKDAAKWGTGYGTIQSGEGKGISGPGSPIEPTMKVVDFENECVKIQMRNEGKRQEHSTTNFQTFIHVVKGNIGTGLLALPLAVHNAGIILGPTALLLMGIIATHCMILLLDVAKHLCKKNNLSCLNYAEAATVAVSGWTNKNRPQKAAGTVVNIFLLITQFGFCCVYFVFMAESLDMVFCEALDITIGKKAWVAILILPVVVFSWIRNLEALSPFSLVANLCIAFCLAVIFYEEIYSFFSFNIDERARILRDPKSFRYFGTVKSIALFFGSVVYAFEGIGMVLPLENKMKTPEKAKRVVTQAMILVTLLYFMFGTTGYIVYGDTIKASITLNLHSSMRLWASIVFVIVKVYFAYAIFASYLLQFYVPMDFLEPAFFNLIKTERFPYYFPRYHQQLKLVSQLGLRTLIVIATAVIALAVPDLEDLIALIGAVASSALALIFPALLEIISFWPDRRERKFLWIFPWQVWVVKDGLILLLGIVGLLFGTYASIASIIENISKPDEHCALSLYRH